MSEEATWKAAHDSAIEGLRMIRETVETLGPPGALPSEEAVLLLYGPEPRHEAQAIVDALVRIMGPGLPSAAPGAVGAKTPGAA